MASTRFPARRRNSIIRTSSRLMWAYLYTAGCICSGRSSSGRGGSGPKTQIFKLGRRHWTQRMRIGRSGKPIIGGRRSGSSLYRLRMDICSMACVAFDLYTGAFHNLSSTNTHCTYSAICKKSVTVHCTSSTLVEPFPLGTNAAISIGRQKLCIEFEICIPNSSNSPFRISRTRVEDISLRRPLCGLSFWLVAHLTTQARSDAHKHSFPSSARHNHNQQLDNDNKA